MKRSKNNLRLESLEQRQMMAGDIQAYVSGGDLIIRGDDAANGVLVSQVADGEYAVVGLGHGGSPTLVNNASEARFTGVIDDIDIRLGAGNDKLRIDNSLQTNTQYYPEAGPLPAFSAVPDDLSIYMNAGDDEVEIAVTDVGGDLYLYTHEGADKVDLSHVSTDGRLWVSTKSRTGDAADEVDATGVFAGELRLWTGDGADNVEFRGQNVVNGNMTVHTEGGDDVVNLLDESVWYRHLRVTGDLTIETGAGNDRVYLRDVEGQQDVTIKTHGGLDVVTVNESSVGFERDLYQGDHMQTGGLTVEAGDDRDSVNLYNNKVANDVVVDLGEGDNMAWIGYTTAGVPSDSDDDPQEASISVRSGAGRDQVSITRSEATDAIMAEVGSGNDGLYVAFNKAPLGSFNLGLGSDMYQLWQNDFDDEVVIDPLFQQIVIPIWP